MANKNPSPDSILLTRMNLHIPTETPIRFSVLKFPYNNALKTFLRRFKGIYQQQYSANARHAPLPYRQLNSVLLALAPSLIQAFEGLSDSEYSVGRMVTLTHYVDGTEFAEDFPSQENLQSLIKLWLERWRDGDSKVKAVMEGDGKVAWDELMTAVLGEPETEWQHHIPPADFLNDLHLHGAMAYTVLPALLTQLLHGCKMTIRSEKVDYPITWRRAHNGDKDGVHLVSSPVSYRGDYFAYRLDFSLETQTGRVNKQGDLHPWVFAHLSIQRYVTGPLRQGNSGRNLSILVGNNREKISGWDRDTTLIRLPIKRNGAGWVWGERIGAFLDDNAFRQLLSPTLILAQPAAYGNYDHHSPMTDDEYRVVYAEGYKFGSDERGRKHQVKTGTSLRERSSIMQGVLTLLGGWLQADADLPIDLQNPKNTVALRDYDYMVKGDSKGKKKSQWYEALKQSLQHAEHEHLQMAVLYRDEEKFLHKVMPVLQKALMGAHQGESPLVTVTPVFVPPILAHHLDTGGLDPQMKYDVNRPDDFYLKWNKQMSASFEAKRGQWLDLLRGITWQPNAQRIALIDSPGIQLDDDDQSDEGDSSGDDNPSLKAKRIDSELSIKGAVRDACNRMGVSSQFLIGSFSNDPRKGKQHLLSGESSGRIKNAILDLILRQQGILYAPPHEIYTKAAGLDAKIAAQLDVIAFCRVQKLAKNIHYALAVRLGANGAVHVMFPNGAAWIPYEQAAHEVGKLFSEARAQILARRTPPALNLEKADLRRFAQHILTHCLERPTLAVIEAEKWRDGGGNDTQKHGWTQLKNEELFGSMDELRFDPLTRCPRSADKLHHLLAVVRLRMNRETPQYTTADDFASEEDMRDLTHSTGYIDAASSPVFHYFSVAGLPKTQKRQQSKRVRETFRGDLKDQYDDIAFKHPQLVEMVPFYVRSDFQSHEGRLQLCRCIHFLRISPGFTMGDILLPYGMLLGETLIEDQLCIINAED